MADHTTTNQAPDDQQDLNQPVANTPEKFDKYVHLVGPAKVKHEDGKFTMHFIDAKGEPIVGVAPLVFSEKNESIIFLNMHLVAELWLDDFDKNINNFKQAFPSLKTVIELETSKTSPFGPFMTTTDPPQNIVKK